MRSSRWPTSRLFAAISVTGMLAFYSGRFSVSREPTALDSSAASAQPVDTAKLTEPFIREIWEKQWTHLSAQPNSPPRDAELAAAIETLAAQNPARAISLALTESNRRLREDALHAALRGWAAIDANAASEWVLAQPALDREQAVAAILSGAIQHPLDAALIAERLAAGNPALVRDYGARLIFAFGEAGKFDLAAEYAARGAADCRADWLTSAFSRWGAYQPDNAATAALALPDATARQPALQAVISGWAQTDPAGLAEFAVALPSGLERTNALHAALCNWANANPTAAATWIARFAPSPELDAGAAAVATSLPALRQPDVAIGWAKRIVDVDLRSGTLAAVLRDLSNRDPTTARRYAENSSDLNASDRAAVLAGLTLRE